MLAEVVCLSDILFTIEYDNLKLQLQKKTWWMMVIKLWIFWKKGDNIGGIKHDEIDSNISGSESGIVFMIMNNWSSPIMNDDLVFDKPLQARLDREQ